MSWVIRKPGGTYWFRRAVPAKLREIVGKREVLVSLNTKDPAVAKRRAVVEAAKADRVRDEARKALENPAVHVYKKLQEDAETRARRPRSDDEEVTEALAITDALERLDGDRSPDATMRRATLEAVLKRLQSGDDSADNPPLSILFDRWKAEKRPSGKTWLEWDGARQEIR